MATVGNSFKITGAVNGTSSYTAPANSYALVNVHGVRQSSSGFSVSVGSAVVLEGTATGVGNPSVTVTTNGVVIGPGQTISISGSGGFSGVLFGNA